MDDSKRKQAPDSPAVLVKLQLAYPSFPEFLTQYWGQASRIFIFKKFRNDIDAASLETTLSELLD